MVSHGCACDCKRCEECKEKEIMSLNYPNTESDYEENTARQAVQWAVVQVLSYLPKRLRQKLLISLSTSDYVFKLLVAKHKDSPHEALINVAKEADRKIAQVLVRRKNLPNRVFDILESSEDDLVIREAHEPVIKMYRQLFR